MQQLSEQDVQTARVNDEPRKRKTTARRKVTVRLSERVCGRLDIATDRPGVGKSMFVEAALEKFLSPAPSAEDLIKERVEQMYGRFDRLEHDLRVMAETVALCARYQLAVTPPVPQDQQREAVLRGDERFRILADQVDRRVRQHRPLMQETIERLKSPDPGQMGKAMHGSDEDQHRPQQSRRTAYAQCAHVTNASPHDNEGDVIGSQAIDRPAHRQNFAQNPQKSRYIEQASRNPKLSERRETTEHPLSKWRLTLSVFLPFAAGYFLSFLFRTISASISPALAFEFGLGADEMGLLAAVYFLAFASFQIPIGVLLDRYGPRRIQGVLLVIAGGGATFFGNADNLTELLIGRAMLGLGVAASLMAGLKAIVTWFPRDRIALVNGGMIMLGSLGAVTATIPTDALLSSMGWRNLFELLTFATLATAGLIYLVVPERGSLPDSAATSRRSLTLRSIFGDTRFLRIAPLSAACIGSSWSMQSLWAASWLSDVEGLDHQAVVNQLFTMALGVSLGALLLGTLADRLRKRGISTEVLLAAFACLFMLAELALILRVQIPTILPWCIVSVMGAGTVLSYAVIANYFPVEIAARANGAMNLLHFGWAFAAQYGIGLVVGRWSSLDGHYPTIAYQWAFGTCIAFQAVALIWFSVPWLRKLTKDLLLHLYGMKSLLSLRWRPRHLKPLKGWTGEVYSS